MTSFSLLFSQAQELSPSSKESRAPTGLQVSPRNAPSLQRNGPVPEGGRVVFL